MNLVIDIGNTSCKVASYDALTQKSVQRFEDPSDLQAKTGSGYDTIVLASVRNEDRSLREHLKTRCRRFIDFNVDYVREQVAGGPAIYKYLDNMPDGMGADRMAAILQASILMPEEDILLFDFGTATTVEFIDKGHYVGGAISLGLNMRYRALSHFTGKIRIFTHRLFHTRPTRVAGNVQNWAIADMCALQTDFSSHHLTHLF